MDRCIVCRFHPEGFSHGVQYLALIDGRWEWVPERELAEIFATILAADVEVDRPEQRYQIAGSDGWHKPWPIVVGLPAAVAQERHHRHLERDDLAAASVSMAPRRCLSRSDAYSRWEAAHEV